MRVRFSGSGFQENPHQETDFLHFTSLCVFSLMENRLAITPVDSFRRGTAQSNRGRDGTNVSNDSYLMYRKIAIFLCPAYFRKVDGRVRRKAKAYGLEPELSRRMFRYRSR